MATRATRPKAKVNLSFGAINSHPPTRNERQAGTGLPFALIVKALQDLFLLFCSGPLPLHPCALGRFDVSRRRPLSFPS